MPRSPPTPTLSPADTSDGGVFPSVRVADLSSRGKGRGLLATRPFAPGAVVLQEAALDWCDAADAAALAQPIELSARLASRLLAKGLADRAAGLEPALADFAAHPAAAARGAELRAGRGMVRANCDAAANANISDAALERLLLAITLNAHGVRPKGRGGGELQGLFPQWGTMMNHSCTPNCASHARLAPGGELVLVVVAVAPIAKGDEVCISYLPSLYASFPDRDEQLRSLYFFPAERRAGEIRDPRLCCLTCEMRASLPSERPALGGLQGSREPKQTAGADQPLSPTD